ncbi:TRAP transporter small permease [Paracoccus sp. (in: a-proteobacteria)]|uniref:TRAP transporter small permease n=1 Tax=Paracoccus sp. TaxID=267 RepID=UPI002AFE8718|nr:TRAP transporter small permease [Paracoccus sp. (in: a-proteobacteria)]
MSGLRLRAILGAQPDLFLKTRGKISVPLFFNTLDRAVILAGKVMIGLGALFALGIAILGSADVLAFLLLGTPIRATREFSETMLAVLIFSSMPRAFCLSQHVSVDLFIGSNNGTMAKIQRIATAIVGLFVFGLLAWNGGNMALTSTLSNELAVSSVRFPVWPIKILVAASMIVTLAEFIRQVVMLFRSNTDNSSQVRAVQTINKTNGS